MYHFLPDKFLMMSDALAVTVTADSAVLDLGHSGDEYQSGLFWVLRVNTAFDGAATFAASLQTADGTSFAALPGCALAATATANLTEGAVLVHQPLPLGLKAKLKTVYTVSGEFSGGKVDSFITGRGFSESE